MIKRAGTAAMAGLVGLTLAGCGVGPDAATARQLPSVPGVSVTEGGVGVRNAAVMPAEDEAGYEPGSTAPVQLWVVNDTPDLVRLTGASSPAAGSVTGADGLEVPGYGLVGATLELTDLATDALTDAAGSVPLTLTFDNGVELALDVPVAPPESRSGERPAVEDAGHGHA